MVGWSERSQHHVVVGVEVGLVDQGHHRSGGGVDTTLGSGQGIDVVEVEAAMLGHVEDDGGEGINRSCTKDVA